MFLCAFFSAFGTDAGQLEAVAGHQKAGLLLRAALQRLQRTFGQVGAFSAEQAECLMGVMRALQVIFGGAVQPQGAGKNPLAAKRGKGTVDGGQVQFAHGAAPENFLGGDRRLRGGDAGKNGDPLRR